jgi:ADP-heptose:LPS heptosyltransferase
MQNWVPHLPVEPYPDVEQLGSILHAYDWYFVVWNDSSEFVRRLISEGKRRFPDRMKVIYFYPSPNIVNEPYYPDTQIDPRASVAANLRRIAHQIMKLPKTASGNGFIPPAGLQHRKHLQRIVVHPTSAKIRRNWPKEKFVKLALHLVQEGYHPIFVPGKEDLPRFSDLSKQGLQVEDFPSLDLFARFIYESGYFIGNDSGPGHLASALGVPTLTFCRRKALADLWAPSFAPGIVLTPSRWIPNFRGLRLRDHHWGKFIGVGRARRAFERLKSTLKSTESYTNS